MGALARGDVAHAVEWNPLVIPVTVLLVVELVYRGLVLLPGRAERAGRSTAIADLAVHVALAAIYCGYSVAFLLGWT